MKISITFRLAGFAALLTMLLQSSVFAQEVESTRQERMRRAEAAKANRAESNRARSRRQVDVKDPSTFQKSLDRPQFSGPQPGEPLLAFNVSGTNGELEGETFDPIENAKGDAHLLVFQDESGAGLRGMLGLSRMVGKISQNSKSTLTYSSILLGDDPEALRQMASRIRQHVPDFVVMAVSEDGRDGPGSYGLNRNIAMTVIVAKDGKVAHNFVFPQSMLYPDPHVLGAIADVIGEDRETVKQWLSQDGSVASKMRMETGNRMETENTGPAGLRSELEGLVKQGKLERAEAVNLFRIAFPDERLPVDQSPRQ
ncbi:MAG: hypothetical protein AAF664_20655 [Planctomycetota bacterium]